MSDGKTRIAFTIATFAACLSGCAASTGAPALPDSQPPAATPNTVLAAEAYVHHNPIPPRMQWNANYGYCGEVSFISAGLYYGQYLSQYDARALASPGVPQNRATSQLLLGVNDVGAAKAMHLTFTRWNWKADRSARAFLAWLAGEVVEGHPVVIGVYNNEYRIYGKKNPNAGQAEYDHIVPVVAVGSNAPLTEPIAYRAGDALTFSDNGLWTGTPSGKARYFFRYRFGPFQATRRQANAPDGPVYSLDGDGRDYGIALTGVADANGETLPVRITTSANDEKPSIKNGSNVRPAGMPLTLTVTVSGLTPGTKYTLYRYDDAAAVPNRAFNAHASSASASWPIDIASGSTYTLQEHIESSDEAFYRAVPATAP
jgi:hypothetical protein